MLLSCFFLSLHIWTDLFSRFDGTIKCLTRSTRTLLQRDVCAAANYVALMPPVKRDFNVMLTQAQSGRLLKRICGTLDLSSLSPLISTCPHGSAPLIRISSVQGLLFPSASKSEKCLLLQHTKSLTGEMKRRCEEERRTRRDESEWWPKKVNWANGQRLKSSFIEK